MNKDMDKTLRYAAISGILLVVVLAIRTFINLFISLTLLMQSYEMLPTSLSQFYNLLSIPLLILSIIFLWGFKLVGGKTQNRLLKFTSILLIFTSIVGIGYSLLLVLFLPHSVTGQAIVPYPYNLLVMALALLGGVFRILFGVGLLKLRKNFGSTATAAGILEIIEQMLYPGAIILALILPISQLVSLIFTTISFFIRLMAVVLEVVILFRASEKL